MSKESNVEKIVSNFISLKFDVDTNEFSNGTQERWNTMLEELEALIASEVQKAIDSLPQLNYEVDRLSEEVYAVYPTQTIVHLSPNDVKEYVAKLRMKPLTQEKNKWN